MLHALQRQITHRASPPPHFYARRQRTTDENQSVSHNKFEEGMVMYLLTICAYGTPVRWCSALKCFNLDPEDIAISVV
jgi:hypothetical protein